MMQTAKQNKKKKKKKKWQEEYVMLNYGELS